MVDILHRVGVRAATTEDVYAALTTVDGLCNWWTRDTSGDPSADGVLAFRFGRDGIDMKVVELVPGERVLWEVVDGPAEWIGTRVSFDLSQAGEYAVVLFAHRGWAEPVEFMNHCSTKWGTFLLSLKQLIETGQGAPAPDDVRIGDWH